MATVLLIVFIFCISTTPANADSTPPPWSYEIEFEEQDLVFRMNVTDIDFNPEKSGMYVKSTGKKIYTVHEYYYEGLYFSADRSSFAVMTWQKKNEDRGVIFYVDGVMSYVPVTDLMKNLDAREYSSSHYDWEVHEKRVYDEKNSTLSILTNDGISYTFDIKEGKIIHRGDINDHPVDESDKPIEGNKHPIDENENIYMKLTWKTTLIFLIVLGIGAAALYYVMKRR